MPDVKNIPAIKVGNEIYELKDLTAREHLFEVRPANDPPTSEDNKIWVHEQADEIVFPVLIDETHQDYELTMPQVAKTGMFNYKDPETGRYIGVNVLSERRTADQIAEIDEEAEEMLTVLRSTFVQNSEKAQPNGVATLDGGGKVPAAQLPSYVDDVLEYPAKNVFPATGEAGKIYVASNDGKIYRWSGSQYIEISNATDVLDDTKGDGSTTFTWTANKLYNVFAAENGRIDAIVNSVGAPSGIASLDANTKVPNAQLQNLINDTAGDSDINVTWSADKLYDILNVVNTRLADLEYVPIEITALTVSPSVVEDGSIQTSAVLNYTLNKAANRITLDGANRPETAASGTIALSSLSLTAKKTWTLGTIDERDRNVTKNTSMTFTNKVKYGAAAEPGSINDAFLNGLSSRILSTGKVRSFSVNAESGQYIWYALPSSYGTCKFTVGGFTGGFTQVALFNHQNESGKVVEYRVYRSDNKNLGLQNISVT